jgi:hypothetical protein
MAVANLQNFSPRKEERRVLTQLHKKADRNSWNSWLGSNAFGDF